MKKTLLPFLLLASTGAQAATFVEAADNLFEPLSFLTSTLEVACFVVGGCMVIGAIMLFRQHRSQPKLVPLPTPIVVMIIGITTLFIPYFASTDAAAPAPNKAQKQQKIEDEVAREQAEAAYLAKQRKKEKHKTGEEAPSKRGSGYWVD